jgi:hypothetical protein
MSPVGSSGNRANPQRTNYSSFLPEVYSGHPNRLERYQQYDTMDGDSEVNAALDILAEFCSQPNEGNGTPFELNFKEQATPTEVKVLRRYLQQWTRLNKFNNRIFKIVRNAFKYGDCFFVRDPETQQWLYIDPAKVDRIIVNESEGKIPEQYVIRDLNINLQNLTVTQITPNNTTGTPGTSNYMTSGAGGARGMAGSVPTSGNSRFQMNQNQFAIDAKHVIHLSMSEGLDNNFPFGNSLLESIFKVYKQKELLEDSIIIYRVQRAPERRVFYIDVGNMPSHLAMGFVERVKNEVNQRRIPSVTGGGSSLIDAAYNPLSQNEDYFFPQTCLAMDQKVKLLDGRNLKLIDIIEEYNKGKENWAYTVNQKTFEIEPGKIVWAGKTRLNTQLVEVLLDNGEKIKVTPDHRFIMRDGSEVEAQFLKEHDSLMPLYLHDATTGKHQGANKILPTDTTLVKIAKHLGYKGWSDFKENYQVNHKVVSITWLEEKEDTGDITIESISNSHNFALTAGVFIHNSEGRGSKVELLPGGTNLGEIDDLRYFTNKLFRALRIPSSYLPTGPDDGGSSFNDGRVGTAYIQELRFNKYCERLQGLISESFNLEFKLFLNDRGVNVDPTIFDVRFNPPQNFASYRQAEMDTARVTTFASMIEIPFISNRFALKRFLGLSEEEITENETLWKEENLEDSKQHESASAELRSAGVTAGGAAQDMSNIEDAGVPPEGMEGAAPQAAQPAAPIQ